MKNLIILGARGFGREVYDLAKYSLGYGTEFVVKGFLDDNKEALNGFVGYPEILDSVENYIIQENDTFICALGAVKWADYYSKIITSKGGNFINLIHKKAVLRQNVKLGVGIIIAHGSLISADVTIGNFSQIMSYCILGHDVVVGKYCRIGDYAFLGGFTQIEDNVFVAVRSTLVDRIVVGSNSVIGVGSVVIKNVKENTSVFGVPAKKIEQ
jgi:sugar O-acyltransferase (sialic acid O-acetyltransferase NeuD family)